MGVPPRAGGARARTRGARRWKQHEGGAQDAARGQTKTNDPGRTGQSQPPALGGRQLRRLLYTLWRHCALVTSPSLPPIAARLSRAPSPPPGSARLAPCDAGSLYLAAGRFARCSHRVGNPEQAWGCRHVGRPRPRVSMVITGASAIRWPGNSGKEMEGRAGRLQVAWGRGRGGDAAERGGVLARRAWGGAGGGRLQEQAVCPWTARRPLHWPPPATAPLAAGHSSCLHFLYLLLFFIEF